MEVLKKLDSDVNVIVFTGYGTIESAVQAVKGGAYYYITKAIKSDEVEVVVRRAMERHTIQRQMHIFRGMFLFTLLTIPFLILLLILLISA